MNYFSIDHFIVGAFLLTTLVVGLWAGRGIKDFKEYALANKMYGTGMLTMTLIATFIGGWHLFGFPGDIFAEGLTHLSLEVLVGVVYNSLFIAWFIAPKMQYFKDCLSMGDLMHSFYGEYAQMVTGFLGVVYNVAVISTQVIFLGYICELLGISTDWGLSLAALTLVVYTAQGGIRAVTITDMLQFMAVVAAVPLLAHLVTYQAGGIRALLNSVPKEKLNFFDFGQATNCFDTGHYFSSPLMIIWILFPGFLLSFPFIQRMLMAKHTRQVVNMYYISTAFLVTFLLLLTLIGLAALVIYPQIDSKDVLSHIITHLPGGLKGLAWAALLAIVMSTVDSFLHAAGVSFTHDLLKPLLAKKGIAINELRGVQYTTLLIGCLAIVVALRVRNVFTIVIYGVDLAALLFTIPLIAGIMGLKTDTRSFFIALLTTLTVFTLTKPYLNEEISMPICILVNALSFFGAHYLRNKGFAGVNRAAKQPSTYVWHPTWKAAREKLTHVLPTPKKLLRYSQDKVAKYGANPTLFALFMAFSYMVPFFMHSYADPAHYSWLLGIRGVGALLCVGLLLQPLWPARLLPYFPTYYHFSLFYCLPFVTTFLFLLEGSSMEWLINASLAIMLLIVLADWVSFIVLAFLGVSLGLVSYKLLSGNPIIPPDSNTLYTLVYACLFSTLIGLLFARRRQQRFDRVAIQNQALTITDQENKAALLETFKEKIRLIKTLKQAGIEDLSRIAKLLKELRAKDQAASEGHSPLTGIIQQLVDTVIPMTVALERVTSRATDYLRLAVKTITIDQLLAGIEEKLRVHNLHKSIHFKTPTQHQQLTCDAARISQLLVNSIAALREATNEEQPIWVSLADTKLTYPLDSVRKDYVKKVPALGFTVATQPSQPALEQQYAGQMNEAHLPMPATAQEFLLLTNQRIITAHYGYTNVAPPQAESSYLYVIPVHLDEVRPKDMDKPDMELGAELIRADDTYPGAQEQEAAFLAAVAQRTTADIETIKTALEMIKWYHGPVNRKSGEPFYLHPLAVAQIVLDYSQDEATILGALLHDTVEDTAMLLENIETVFGEEVVRIVDGVTNLESNQESFYKLKLSAHENILMLLEVADQRALYVKIADRIHNLRTIKAKAYESQCRTAKETLQFFVPLAEKLGLQAAASELKERSLAVLGSS